MVYSFLIFIIIGFHENYEATVVRDDDDDDGTYALKAAFCFYNYYLVFIIGRVSYLNRSRPDDSDEDYL